jgi:hypothetical protein
MNSHFNRTTPAVSDGPQADNSNDLLSGVIFENELWSAIAIFMCLFAAPLNTKADGGLGRRSIFL